MTVRVRIAPAPSGSLHIGNARTALYNWLFARHHGGVFILRIEDTDPSRVVPEHYATIQRDLQWLGLEWDEGPHLSSERLGLYREAVERLVEAGAVFRCWCTAAELKLRREAALASGGRPGYDGRCRRLSDRERAAFEAEGRPSALRLHVPHDGATSFHDLVTGEVTVRHEDLDDIVLVRSDGRPLYNLAVTVDDGAMAVSHVIRGLDLQSSTPYQIILHRLLGNPVPRYAHIPLVTGPGGAPLSKRFGGDSVAWFRERGFLPEAMVNYLALLGWGAADQTLFTRDELVAAFELEKVHASPAMLDMDKLEWMNGEYVRGFSDEALAVAMEPFFLREGLSERSLIVACAPLVKTRIKRLEEAPGLVRSMFVDVEPAPEAVEKALGQPYVPDLLKRAAEVLSGLEPWEAEPIGAALRGVQAELGVGRKAFQALYVAITGSTTAAPLFDLMAIVGRERCLARLEAARALVG